MELVHYSLIHASHTIQAFIAGSFFWRARNLLNETASYVG